MSNNGVTNATGIYMTENGNELRELRQLTPPLPFAVRAAQVQCIINRDCTLYDSLARVLITQRDMYLGSRQYFEYTSRTIAESK